MKRNENDLMDHITYFAEITCCNCKQTGNDYNANEMYTPEKFFKDGWRATVANAYCPKCAKKYLKGV